MGGNRKMGVGTGILKWELVDQKNMAGLNSWVCSGLNSAKDLEYRVKIKLNIPSYASAGVICMNPNSDGSTANKWNLYHYVDTNNAHGQYSYGSVGYMRIGETLANYPGYYFIDVKFVAMGGGMFRPYHSVCKMVYPGSRFMWYEYSGWWADSSTTISSLGFTTPSTATDGTIEVYRKVVV